MLELDHVIVFLPDEPAAPAGLLLDRGTRHVEQVTLTGAAPPPFALPGVDFRDGAPGLRLLLAGAGPLEL